MKMKHLKKFEDSKVFEDIDSFMQQDDVQEDDYLETPEYFIETWINGQTGQLRTMLQMFRSQNRMVELINYIDENMFEDKEDLKNWMIQN